MRGEERDEPMALEVVNSQNSIGNAFHSFFIKKTVDKKKDDA